jgi:hypothetical protein
VKGYTDGPVIEHGGKELEHKVADAAKRPHLRPLGWLRDSAKPLTQAAAMTTDTELLFR